MRRCFKQNCPEDAFYKCPCKENDVYTCLKHLDKHLMKKLEQGTHNYIEIVKKVSKPKVKKYEGIIEKLIQNLDEAKNQAAANLEIMIKFVKKSFSDCQDILRSKQVQLEDVLARIKSKKPVSIDFLQEIIKTEGYYISHIEDTDSISKEIENKYQLQTNFLDKSGFKEALLFSGFHSEIITIDLQTFKSRALDFLSTIQNNSMVHEQSAILSTPEPSLFIPTDKNSSKTGANFKSRTLRSQSRNSIRYQSRQSLDESNLDTSVLPEKLQTPSLCIGEFCTALEISPGKFFVHGGKKRSVYLKESFIINMQRKTFKKLQFARQNAEAACVLKGNFLYIFGGVNMKGAHDDCFIFNVKLKRTITTHSLPRKSRSNTAGLFEDEIYIAGYDMEVIYCFNENEYRQSLHVGDNQYKILCNGWVLLNNKLFNMIGKDAELWPCKNINYAATQLNSSCFFVKDKFIYFIDYEKNLMRIDTYYCRVESVEYK